MTLSLVRRVLLSRRSNNVLSYVSRQSISSTCRLLGPITVNVPSMGDSITEGTIVEWLKVVGDPVKVDDVVALVETDKVTVEIKADVDGVIKGRFAAVDETVEVGAALYEIDTDADVSQMVSSADKSSELDEKSTKIPTELISTKISSDSRMRIPSIQFLGRAGWAARRSLVKHEEETDIIAEEAYNIIQNLDAPSIDPMYGRPMFTEDEMEAIELGGANMCPAVKKYSSGAQFA